MENIICNLCAGSPDIELYPINLTEQKRIYVDICIGKEIETLLQNDIKTYGCCCGHGKFPPTCLVDKKSKEKLDILGYKYKNYNNTDMYEVILKTDIQFELRKVISNKVFRYLNQINL